MRTVGLSWWRSPPLLDPGFLVFSSGGHLLALPAQSVQAIMNWCLPRALPRSAPWVEGVLVGQGEALPVLREGYCWGAPVENAEIYVLITLDGRSLALPGTDPRMVSARPQIPAGDDLQGPWSGTIDEARGIVRCLDVDKLYMALGLH